VLSDEALRQKYDEKGKEGLDEHSFVDSSAFFTMLFGNDQFEHLIGRLQLATLAAAGAELRREDCQAIEERRQLRLAVKLSQMLDSYDPKNPELFEKNMKEQADTLVKASYGEPLLHAIGFTYQNQAEQTMNDVVVGLEKNVFKGIWASGKQRMHRMKAQWNAAQAAYSVYKQASTDAKAVEGEEEAEGNEAARRAIQEAAMLPHFLEALWQASSLDIDSTLRLVCKRVLYDKAVKESAKKKQRVDALLRLARIFQDAKAPVGHATSAQEALEEAMRAAMMHNDEDDPRDGADHA